MSDSSNCESPPQELHFNVITTKESDTEKISQYFPNHKYETFFVQNSGQRGSVSGKSAITNAITAIAATQRLNSTGLSLSIVSASVW